MQNRISMLDAFYTAHLDDERSLLFDKQRLKLRKLLAEYDAAVASLSGGASLPPSTAGAGTAEAAAYGGSGGELGLVVSRQINEDSRLSVDDLLAWFTQAGAGSMPEMTAAVVEKVYANITRTNLDGKMSIRDLRQWYISFGKRALREGVGNFDSELVPAALVKTTHKATSKAAISLAAAERTKPMYAWEKTAAEGEGASGSPAAASALGGSAALAASGLGRSTAGSVSAGAIGLPNHMLEFQIRLTPEEYHAMGMKRRALEAELRYKDRVKKAQEKEAKLRGADRKINAETDASTSIFREQPYQDHVNLNSILYRSAAK